MKNINKNALSRGQKIAKLILLVTVLIWGKTLNAQCMPLFSAFTVNNNLSCEVEVWLEFHNCNAVGSIAVGTGGIIRCGSSLTFAVPASLGWADDVDVIVRKVGGTIIPSGTPNSEINPCAPGACLPGWPVGGSCGVTPVGLDCTNSVPGCPIFTIGSFNITAPSCDIN